MVKEAAVNSVQHRRGEGVRQTRGKRLSIGQAGRLLLTEGDAGSGHQVTVGCILDRVEASSANRELPDQPSPPQINKD